LRRRRGALEVETINIRFVENKRRAQQHVRLAHLDHAQLTRFFSVSWRCDEKLEALPPLGLFVSVWKESVNGELSVDPRHLSL
jgi:hypothetical protein